MDVLLPSENGFELMRRLKTAHPDITILIITRYGSLEYRETTYESGVGGVACPKNKQLPKILLRKDVLCYKEVGRHLSSIHL